MFRPNLAGMLSRRTAALLVTVAVAVLATGAAVAHAGTTSQILSECTSGQLSQHFSVAALRKALSALPASTQEYTSCSDVIQSAILQDIRTGDRGSGGSGSGGGSFLPTPVIVILALLILAALAFGALAVRRRRGGPGDTGAV